MNFFPARRIRNLLLLLLLAAGGMFWVRWETQTFQPVAIHTGWLLLGLVVFLAAYNLRKKLSTLRLGRSSTWLQLHVYGGLLAIGVFICHAWYEPSRGWRVPQGVFEQVLAGVFVFVAASGIFGLVISRFVPPRLTQRGGEVIYERIPALRRRLQEEAGALALASVSGSEAVTLADFYARRLATFFDAPRHFWHHVIQSSRPRLQLLGELKDLDRYLSAEQKKAAAQIGELIAGKDDLDYHHALQRLLKSWVFLHIGMTYGLLLLALVHAALAIHYSGVIW